MRRNINGELEPTNCLEALAVMVLAVIAVVAKLAIIVGVVLLCVYACFKVFHIEISKAAPAAITEVQNDNSN